MKYLILIMPFMVGCGAYDRWISSITGDASEVCHKGVVYLQLTSGASVMYNSDGKIATCK